MSHFIAITMCYDKEDRLTRGVEYDYIRREYGEMVRQAGGQPLFVDPSTDPAAIAELCDGVVISGGEDIDPRLYGAHRHSQALYEPRERTEWEQQIIAACDHRNVPILGICYGNQLLNLYYGGSLYQDIASEHSGAMHHGTSKAPVTHNVTFSQAHLGYAADEVVAVTSRHHQAVKRVAPGFSAVGRANDGVVEAIAGHGHFGVQWHAESDDSGSVIYGAFVRHCIKNTQTHHLKARRRSLVTR